MCEVRTYTQLLCSSLFFDLNLECDKRNVFTRERADDEYNQYSIFYELDARNHIINSKRYAVFAAASSFSFICFYFYFQLFYEVK